MPAEYRSGRKYRVRRPRVADSGRVVDCLTWNGSQVLFDYDAETEEELTIREGQVVAVLNEADG